MAFYYPCAGYLGHPFRKSACCGQWSKVFAKACEMRGQATLVELITTEGIAQQFKQVVLISHQHAFDREAFHFHHRMEAGQVVESDLSYSKDSVVEPDQLRPVGAGSEEKA